ncbi:hypothetical protein Pan54_00350 [Rubinisphaera italica]|uniref:Lipoprotein SmpA/OmlA domain-containing protein n=1 Tax=Rubinisphaera italica TaxID=2527969 RepID=A0A5C5X8Z5_9PLAN|nr:hypothetical protein Pan54_00350 [Rubinisphaera italica]
MPQQTSGFRFSSKTLPLFIIFVFCAISICIRSLAINQSTLNQLYAQEDTLTRDMVIEIAGLPQSRNGDQEFCYNVWNGFVFFSDMFCIEFDDAGNVTWMSF